MHEVLENDKLAQMVAHVGGSQQLQEPNDRIKQQDCLKAAMVNELKASSNQNHSTSSSPQRNIAGMLQLPPISSPLKSSKVSNVQSPERKGKLWIGHTCTNVMIEPDYFVRMFIPYSTREDTSSPMIHDPAMAWAQPPVVDTMSPYHGLEEAPNTYLTTTMA